MDPAQAAGTSPSPPAARKSALAFYGVLLALYPAALLAQNADPAGGLAATQLFAFLLPAVVATAGSNLRVVPYLRLARPRPALLALGAGAGAAAALVAASLMTLMERFLPRSWVESHDLSRLFEGPLRERVVLVVVAAALAPVCEEITFRGYLQTTLAIRRGPAAAVAGGAVLFAVLHLDPVRFPAVLVLGAAFGWITWRSGSVWPAVAAHATNNGLAAALFLVAGDRAQQRPPLPWTIGVLALGAASLALLLFAVAAAAPRPPPAAADALALRDPSSPSIRFDPGRVPRPIAAAAAGGMAVLLALALVGLARGLGAGR